MKKGTANTDFHLLPLHANKSCYNNLNYFCLFLKFIIFMLNTFLMSLNVSFSLAFQQLLQLPPPHAILDLGGLLLLLKGRCCPYILSKDFARNCVLSKVCAEAIRPDQTSSRQPTIVSDSRGTSVVGICCLAATGEDTANWEDLACAVVRKHYNYL